MDSRLYSRRKGVPNTAQEGRRAVPVVQEGRLSGEAGNRSGAFWSVLEWSMMVMARMNHIDHIPIEQP